MNNNGDVSFSNPYVSFTVTSFPLSQSVPLAAPFFADVDNTVGSGNVWYRITQDPVLLAKAKSDIPASNFNPVWLFIATWDHVGYYSRHTDKVCKYMYTQF